MICVDDDRARARDLARPWLTIYMGGMGAKGKNFYVDAAERAGFGESAREVQRLFMEGDRAGAAAALSDELIESNAICTDMAGLPERIAEFEQSRGEHPAGHAVRRPAGDRADDRRGGRVASPPVATREELENLSSKELHDRAFDVAKHHVDVGFFWRLLQALPAAEAASAKTKRPSRT